MDAAALRRLRNSGSDRADQTATELGTTVVAESAATYLSRHGIGNLFRDMLTSMRENNPDGARHVLRPSVMHQSQACPAALTARTLVDCLPDYGRTLRLHRRWAEQQRNHEGA